MRHPPPPQRPVTDDNAASNQQTTSAYCWVLLCYLNKQGGEGPTIESLWIPASDSSKLMCDVDRWLGTKSNPTTEDDMTVSCELVWAIRSQPFTDADDKKEQLQALRTIALDIMHSDGKEHL